ncbi:serine hydrolase [Paenibacillus sp. N1-5-1-14]|uniref:serine hydrolase domain-containing protein n=1 Tax=Paenibacillus radicibacter TaxID=2972488 RepID=UPI0021591BE4|nr:serine hydrolase domain-containing protein [Paenibacillus radicibacter]MCR8644482.1 serine hydrolase [Paenibacillus radicibacter]
MKLPVVHNQKFESLVTYTKQAQDNFGASAASVLVIQDNKIVTEWYAGHHHFKNGAVQVTSDSMFNLYSTRKTYVGLATAIAAVEARISIDTKVTDIESELSEQDFVGLTLRDLATKSNLKYYGESRIEREEVACKVIKRLTGHTIAELIHRRILTPLNLTHSQWATVPSANLVCDFQAGNGYASVRIESDEGHERNLYTSARDLAMWGNLFLNKGMLNGVELIPSQVFDVIDQLRQDTEDKSRILGWYHKKHWYYATGAAGCHCVVVPERNAVAVRMLNRYTDKYAEDQVIFNEMLFDCLNS